MQKLLKITILRKLLVALRFIYYVYFLKKMKIENNNSLIAWDFKSDSHKKEAREPQYWAETMNKKNNESLDFSNIKKGFFNIFSGKRSQLLINPLNSCTFINKPIAKVLSIGPRNESEIYCLIANSFKKENISSIDKFTYSPFIKNGDIHDMNQFNDNSFDVIICGWVLAYRYNINKAIAETLRIEKNNAVISIGSTIGSDLDKRLSNNEILRHFPEDIKKKIIFNVDESDFSFESKSKHSILCVSVRKSKI